MFTESTDPLVSTAIIDSHHHIWDPTRRAYPWLTDPRINRPFTLDDLRPELEQATVDATVLVQAVADLDETEELLAVAKESGIVAGVVGWADMTDPGFATTVWRLRESDAGDFLVGIRHQVHDEEDADWLLRAEVQDALMALAEASLTFDLLVRPRELPAAIQVARDFPHLRLVVDHLGKPPIATGELEPWSSLMNEFAGLEHVACKLSGLVTEADEKSWSADDLAPYVNTAVEIFGPQRLMFGSDWPVCLTAASYQQVVSVLREILAANDTISDDDMRAIFRTTAVQWYGLDEVRSEDAPRAEET